MYIQSTNDINIPTITTENMEVVKELNLDNKNNIRHTTDNNFIQKEQNQIIQDVRSISIHMDKYNNEQQQQTQLQKHKDIVKIDKNNNIHFFPKSPKIMSHTSSLPSILDNTFSKENTNYSPGQWRIKALQLKIQSRIENLNNLSNFKNIYDQDDDINFSKTCSYCQEPLLIDEINT